MKISLILFFAISSLAIAADKKADMRQGTKAVDEKYLEDLSGTKIQQQKPQATSDKTQQYESKKSRQFQEERPELTPEEAIKRQR